MAENDSIPCAVAKCNNHERSGSMTTAFDLVERDVAVLASTMRAAFAMISNHPNYSKIDKEDGEMLLDVGLILSDAADRLESLYAKLGDQEVEA